MTLNRSHRLVGLCAWAIAAGHVHAQSTAFTYQGRLNDSGQPATGLYDLRFTLYDAVSSGAVRGGPVNRPAVGVTNGLFTVALDYGAGAFDGADRWLEIAAGTSGASMLTPLTPRQPLTATPYAVRAANFSGAVSDGQLSANIARLNSSPTFTGTVAAGGFTGGGANLTGLNASQLSTGTVPDARLGSVLLSNTFWRLGGNLGTAPGSQFLGTRDNQPLAFRVNNTEALRLSPSNSGPLLRLTGPGGSNAKTTLELATYAPGTNAPAATVQARDNNWSADVVIATKKPGHTTNALVSRLTVKNDGKVGINTDSPGSSLEVLGGIRAWFGPPGANGAFNNGYAFGGGGDTDSGMFSTGDGQVEFYSNNSERMRINPNGNVGIGTNDPQSALHVLGTVQADRFAGNGSELRNLNGNYLSFGTVGPSALASGVGTWLRSGLAGNERYCLSSPTTKVGIGTNDPQSTLHVAGTVLADTVQANHMTSSAREFTISARGGLLIDKQTPTVWFGDRTGQMLNLWALGTNSWFAYGIGIKPGRVYFRTGWQPEDGFTWFQGGRHERDLPADYPGQDGTTMMVLTNRTLWVNGDVKATAFNPTSDRNLKENFTPVNPRDMLDKVVALPIHRWNFKTDPAILHLGPVAQDFHAAFGLGTDDKHIATVDADGVALAAIQGLNEKVEIRGQRSEVRIQTLEAENAALKQRLTHLEELVRKLAAQPKGGG